VRIAYLCFVSAYATDGVNAKIAAQALRWRRAGHEVEVLALSDRAARKTAEPQLPATIFEFAGMADRVRATVRMAAATRRLRPDVVYLRYDAFLPPLAPLLSPLPVVLEINTDDRREYRLHGRAKGAYNRLSRGWTFRRAAGIVCVTHELRHSPGFARYGRPMTVIGNAGDPDLVEPLPPSRGDRPAGVMLIGEAAPWIGLDKVVTLATALPGIDVHLVGRVDANGFPPNVRAHGAMTRQAYREVLAQADFGIGPLALHRTDLSEASPLKVREYLLHGLPVLIAHRDTDFLDADVWFLGRLANREDNVASAVADIDAWAHAVRGRRVQADEVVGRIGIDGKEAARLAFLEGLARTGSGWAAAS
jgi:hypothetical protein